MSESTRAGPFEMFPTPCVENLRRTTIRMARIWIDHLSPDVADDGSRKHGPESDYLRHILLSILLRHVIYHLLPSLETKIYINIRQTYSLGV